MAISYGISRPKLTQIKKLLPAYESLPKESAQDQNYTCESNLNLKNGNFKNDKATEFNI